MCFCIIWGMVLMIFNGKSYVTRLMSGGKSTRKPDADTDAGSNAAPAANKKSTAGFGDIAMTAMFIGLVSAYIASYIGQIISANGLFTFTGNWLPLAVACVSALAMAGFLLIRDKAKADWIDSFSIAGSMLIAMTAAIFLGRIG